MQICRWKQTNVRTRLFRICFFFSRFHWPIYFRYVFFYILLQPLAGSIYRSSLFIHNSVQVQINMYLFSSVHCKHIFSFFFCFPIRFCHRNSVECLQKDSLDWNIDAIYAQAHVNITHQRHAQMEIEKQTKWARNRHPSKMWRKAKQK